MKKSAELIKERAALIEAQKRMHLLAEKETRSYTEEETIEFRRLQGEIDAMNEKIRDAEAFEANLRMMGGAPASTDLGQSEEREHQEMKANYSLHKAIRSQQQNGVLDGIEKELHDETVRRAESVGIAITGIAIPMLEKRAAGQTVTQDSGAYGGNLVATDLQSPIDFLRPQPIVEKLGARFISNLQGNLKFPVNEGGIVATWEGEVDTVANSKNAYGSKTMMPKRLAASVLISLQNLLQSSIDLEMYTIQDIRAVIANAIDLAAINGSGTGDQPLGILNTSGINTIAGGTNGLAPTWAQIVGMETAVFVENANAAKMAYAVNPVTKGKLKTLKHEAGDLGYLMNQDGTINGYPVGVSNLIPGNITKGTGTNLSAGLFGDFSQLIIGQWGFLDLSVDDKSRKKDGYVEVTVNTFLDILVKQPKAFSVVKDWITT